MYAVIHICTLDALEFMTYVCKGIFVIVLSDIQDTQCNEVQHVCTYVRMYS